MHSDLNAIKPEWDTFLPVDSMLRSEHQLGLTEAKIPFLETYFLLIRLNEKLVGITSLQEYEFTSNNFDQTLLSKQLVTSLLKDFIVNQRAHLLIFGNLFRIQNPFHFLPEQNVSTLVPSLMEAYVENRRKEKTFAGIFVKDSASKIETKCGFKLSELKDDLTMHLPINPDWQNLDHYEAELSKKYRKRMQKTRTLAKQIERRELALTEIQAFSEKIFELYKAVVEKQAVRIGIVNAEFFVRMKIELSDKYKLIGYFEKDELIGFASYIFNESCCLEIHYVGFKDASNEQFGLYFNMLFDAIDMAILHQQSLLELGRTARLAKASLGAKAVEQNSYYRMQFGLPSLVFMALSYFFTEKMAEDWQTRNPFKKNKNTAKPTKKSKLALFEC